MISRRSLRFMLRSYSSKDISDNPGNPAKPTTPDKPQEDPFEKESALSKWMSSINTTFDSQRDKLETEALKRKKITPEQRRKAVFYSSDKRTNSLIKLSS